MTWLSWPIRLLVFTGWFAKEIVVASAVVLRDNLTPGQASTPGIAHYATRCRTDAELTLLAALITLTPGTLALGTETTPAGARVLFVHGMYNVDADALRTELRDMEGRMLHAVRRRGGRS
ncbi:multicomponent Na+:H+ antiporter subunit E [Tamaricihabitans halophyticus]|uniref:Multicomponent Na+:H+ antiporter subunit E n=1 Tax=Tamaricihabitans halophyticus TaxID=1262583 RepID=A0A4R2QTE7_9PSEU|nr:Na+/H+ antiporter subunit E [Tamaricihabitans halophyticus]TCP52987.1 multicomponent Na+:H+ antiporter subunit E [Tamaricihabitans halophyticus]